MKGDRLYLRHITDAISQIDAYVAVGHNESPVLRCGGSSSDALAYSRTSRTARSGVRSLFQRLFDYFLRELQAFDPKTVLHLYAILIVNLDGLYTVAWHRTRHHRVKRRAVSVYTSSTNAVSNCVSNMLECLELFAVLLRHQPQELGPCL